MECLTDLVEDDYVECASNLIVGSIINIIDNSIWWTTYAEVPQRYIIIKVTKEIDGHLAIVLADNGCGFTIAPEDAIKPFVSTKPSGMGLGLNVVNEIMLSQGGTLTFPDYGDVELPNRYKNGAIVALVFKEGL
jgi:nitrogen fixation/metabolism regulation signal transduction histidine kinase